VAQNTTDAQNGTGLDPILPLCTEDTEDAEEVELPKSEAESPGPDVNVQGSILHGSVSAETKTLYKFSLSNSGLISIQKQHMYVCMQIYLSIMNNNLGF
jgi:hypothetical protein